MDRGLAITLAFAGIAFVIAIAIFNPSSTLQSISTLAPIDSTGGSNPQLSLDIDEDYGIEALADGIGITDECNTNQVIKRTASGWGCASDQGTSGTATFTVQNGDLDVATSTDTLDFGSNFFSVTESPLGEANIVASTTEAFLEAAITDVSDVFTDNDGALDDDDLTDNDLDDLSDVTATGDASGSILIRNAGDTAYEDHTVSGDATLSAAGALEVAQADALEANGTNCSAGQYPLGVDASGNSESCAGDANSNASTLCSGTTTYLDGEANCDDISGVYVDESGDTMTGDLNMDNQAGVSFFELDANGSDSIGFSATSTLATTTQIYWNIDPSTCTGDGNGGALTVVLAGILNEIRCSADDGGAGGAGDSVEVEDGDNAGTFTAVDTTARFDDGGDINFAAADGGAGGPDSISATVRANSVALATDTTGNYVADITGGDGLAVSGGGSENATVDIDTASEEAGFLNDGGVTSLTCGAAAQGKAQVLDDGSIEYCDGAATSVLQAGFLDADGTDDDTPDSDAEVPDTLTVDNGSTVDPDALSCDVGDDDAISEDCVVANSLDAGEIADDAIGVAELDDGSDTPVAGECIKVAAGAAEFEADACEGITAGDHLTRTGDDVDLDAEVVTDTKGIWFEDPTDADDFQSIWTANGFAATITKIWCESDQTVNLDLQIDDGSPADVAGTDLVCTSTPAEDESGLTGAMADGDRLDLAITSVSGTPTWVAVHWTFTKDD